MRHRSFFVATLAVWLSVATTAHAGLINGIQSIVMGVLQPPIGLLVGTVKGAPIVGTLQGTVLGLAQGVAMVGKGAVEVVGSAVPIAKSVVPYLLPFLL